MIHQTNTPGTARLDARGQRLRVKMRSIDDVQLLHSLPDSRRIPPGSEFSATPTPYGCYRLLTRGYDLSDELVKLAGQWNYLSRVDDWMPKYVTKSTPRAHQVRAFNFSFGKPASMLAMDMGTGKTMTSIALIEAWHAAGYLDWPSFVVCPKIVVPHWPAEWAKHGGLSPQVVPLEGSGKEKAATVTEMYRVWESAKRRGDNRLLVFVDNHESVWRSAMAKVLLSRQWGCIDLDESHRAKSGTSKVSKFLYQWGLLAQRKLALTGTPMPNNPGCLFGQFRFLDAAIYGTGWNKFIDRYAKRNPRIPQAVEEWVNQDEFSDLANLLMFRVEARDVLDLPPEQDVVINVEIEPKLRKAYNELAKEMCTEWGDREVTVDNVLVKMLRLQQLTAGIMVDDNDQSFVVSTAKVDALSQLLGDLPDSEPMVVFTVFRPEREQIKRMVDGRGRRYLEVSGDKKEQVEFIHEGKPGDVLCVQLASGGTGLDGLQHRSRYAVYSSIGNDRGLYQQSRARIARDGQGRPMTFYHLQVRASVDQYLAEGFQRKGEIVDYVMGRVAKL